MTVLFYTLLLRLFDQFIFRGIEGNYARVSLKVSFIQTRDFLMTEEQVAANIATFRSSPALKQARDALSARFRNVCGG